MQPRLERELEGHALARVGRLREGFAIFLNAGALLEAAPTPAVEAGRELLALAAARGEPPHASARGVWEYLEARNAIDARACGAWFAVAMRGGHTREAIQAAKLAEARGLEQSNGMQATMRQIRRYGAKVRAGAGSAGPRDGTGT